MDEEPGGLLHARCGVSCGQGWRELVLKEGARGSEGRCRVGEGTGASALSGGWPSCILPESPGHFPLCFL